MFLEILQKRRSVRRFLPKKVEQEKIEYLVEAMLRSPSSKSNDPWNFVVVDEQEIIEKLSKAKPHGASFMKRAPLAIIVCGDPQKSDVWVEDCSIATILLHLTATDLGLGSCWVQMRMRDYDHDTTSGKYVSELLGLDEGIEVEAIVAIGYPDEQKLGHPRDTLLYDRVSYNRFGQKR